MAIGKKRDLAEVPDEMGRISLGFFKSKSNPDGEPHEVCIGHDNVLYCTCYGWRRLRKDKDGKEVAVRSCPHTRSIEAGWRRMNGGRPLPTRTTDKSMIEGAERVRRNIVLDEGDEE